tara:strand:+ start:4923 stop:5603 length:681 start_codon:yes stop_codon:yes gene_type:complete
MTEIILYGKLAHEYKKTNFEFSNIKNPIDSVKALDTCCKNFKKKILKYSEKGMFYEFLVDGNEIKSKQDFFNKKEIKKIEIIPAICGKDPITAFFVNLAVNLLVSGIMYLLTPMPEIKGKDITAPVKAQSFLFSNKLNTASQGTTVPLGYGRLRVGSKVIEVKLENIERDEYSYVLQNPDSINRIDPYLTITELGYDTRYVLNDIEASLTDSTSSSSQGGSSPGGY